MGDLTHPRYVTSMEDEDSCKTCTAGSPRAGTVSSRQKLAAAGPKGGEPMFEALEDHIRIDEEKATPKSQRLMLWAGVTVVSIILFGALYFGIQLLSAV